MRLFRTNRTAERRPAPVLEGLENRTLYAANPPAVTAVLDPSSGMVNVTGTRQSDTIVVALNAGQLEVTANGAVVGTFPAGGLAGLSVSGGNGHDTISVDAAVSLPATLLGGNGRDSLSGGSGNDTVDGGNGRDNLLGNAGNDTLTGGNGKDVLDGGAGDDNLSGGRARDTVTGGAGTDTFTGDNASEILEKEETETVIAPVKRHGRK